MRRIFVLPILGLTAIASTSSAEEPAPKPAVRSVTLTQAVQQATSKNPTAEVAAREVQRAEALARQARAAWLPTLTANATYLRLDDDRELNGRVILSANQLSANVQLSVPLIAGQRWVAHARAKETAEIARSSGVDTRRTVALAAARAYLTVVAQHRVLNSAERALATAKAHEEYASTRFKGGVGNRLDATRAAQERATAEVRVRTQLTGLARAQEALGIAVGEEGRLDSTEDASLGDMPSVDAALADAASTRADITVLRSRVETSRKAVRDSWVDYMPTLTAIAQPFYQNPATFTQPQTGWQAQLVFSLPLFDGGARYGVKEEREATLAQNRARLEGALRQARSEVRVAFEAMRRADESLQSARDAATLARESLDLAQVAYQAGATSNIEVVDAERRAHEAETAAAVAEDEARQARLDLLAASGHFP